MDSNLQPDFASTFDRATKGLNLCPHRVWTVAGKDLPYVMPSGKRIPPHKNHQQCTFDFREHSQRDFTAIRQRHECTQKTCAVMQDSFSREALNEAIKAGELTVWTLDGKSLLPFPSPFIAVSHVWSDGTGAGAWQNGEVNKCLYAFFQRIAEQFRCDGIW